MCCFWCRFGEIVSLVFLVVSLILAGFIWAQRRRVATLKYTQNEIKLEENRVFNFLHGLGEAFSEGMLSSELHRLIVEGAVNILKAKGGAIYLIDNDGKTLVPSFLSENLPPLVVIPEFVRRSAIGFLSLSSVDRKFSSTTQNFLRLHAVPRGQGLIGKAWEWKEARFLDKKELDPLLVEQGLYSALLGPLIYRNKTVGVLLLANGPKSKFSQGGIEVFSAIAGQAAFALYNQVIYKEASEKQFLDRDLKVAQDIQKFLLPSNPPVMPGYQISGINIPARALSGDYFDYIAIDENHVGIAIADVSGKGIPAAIMMAMCRSALRSQSSGHHSPTKVLQQVNRQLYSDIKEDMFISMAYVIINPHSNEALLARAGHDAPLLYHAHDGSIEALKPKGMAVGIDSGEVFDTFSNDFSFRFEQGDCLLLYTDGVTEALNSGGLEFGLERLIHSFKESAADNSSNLLKRLTNMLRTFVAHHPQNDDITLISIRKL
ncbi:MAG: GAF domain-containing SpoIIE family protein phosphatase [Chthoniobacterales bacterium]